jgi:hypothetical protein
MTDKPIYAWHFSTDELDFDMQGTKVEAGLTVSMDDNPIVRFKGFHACIRSLDALDYFAQRPNPDNLIIVSRVRLSGQTTNDASVKIIEILSEDDLFEFESPHLFAPATIVAQKREHLWIADAKSTVEVFGVWCYKESLNILRDKNYVISSVFDEALIARLENSASLTNLAELSRNEATLALELKPLLERLAVSLTMNVVDFALANADTLIRTNKHSIGFTNRFSSEADVAYYKAWQVNHAKFREMLMQLAPEGYREP